MGMIQTFAVVIDYSMLDLLKPLGVTLSGDNLFTEILTVPVARIGALLPFVMMILILLVPAARPAGDARHMSRNAFHATAAIWIVRARWPRC